MERGFYHASRGYWQTTGDVPEDVLATYPEGTEEVPLKPVVSGVDHAWVDGAWQSLPPNLDALRAARVQGLRADCAADIVGGFSSSALGAAHQYPSAQTDQINLMGSVTASLLPDLAPEWETPFWCADGAGMWAFRPHSAAQIQQVGADGKAHVVAAQATLDGLVTHLATAATPEDIAAIVWPV